MLFWHDEEIGILMKPFILALTFGFDHASKSRQQMVGTTRLQVIVTEDYKSMIIKQYYIPHQNKEQGKLKRVYCHLL